MHWIIPKYSKGRVDRAGRALVAAVADELPAEELRVANNWRAAHAFPLNTFQNGLRRQARRVGADALVSQRIKRTPSTIAKLRRFPGMKLSRMQDVGGCRAVVDTVEEVAELRESYGRSRMKHRPANGKDYIARPKESGYRGIHLVYRYRSERNEAYNGLLIEIQLRSGLQHAWATAVETAGAFLGQALKSSEGEEDWLRFFALVSSAFAASEGCPTIPCTPSEPAALRDAIRSYARNLDVIARLTQYRALIDRIPVLRSVANSHFFLLERRPDLKNLYVTGYGKDELAKVAEDYLAMESKISGIDGAETVLVSADSVQAVQRAYPNYQLDTSFFLKQLKRVTETTRRTPRAQTLTL